MLRLVSGHLYMLNWTDHLPQIQTPLCHPITALAQFSILDSMLQRKIHRIEMILCWFFHVP
jgi:hypothetical protein